MIFEGLLPELPTGDIDKLKSDCAADWKRIDEDGDTLLSKAKKTLSSHWGQFIMLALIIPIQMYLRQIYYADNGDDLDIHGI